MRNRLQAGAALVLALMTAACQPHQFKATVLQPPKPITDFTVDSTGGATFTLSKFQDRFVILYFGYTNCPDVCPATLAQLKQTLDKLGPDADKVTVVFATVDPQRDSLDRLKTYLSNFNPNFIGIRTAGDGALKDLTGQFGIYFEAGPQDSGVATGYPVMHTSSVLVLNKMGLRALFTSETSAADMAADLRELVRSQ